MEPERWLACDETAKVMLQRVTERRLPSLTPMVPLHRVSLHGGHVLEVAGGSGSGKSELLLQAAVTCIMPKQWGGVRLGGSERAAMLFDLDCHFDILRLVHLLKCHIEELKAGQGFQVDTEASKSHNCKEAGDHVDEIISSCLKRFFHIRCYNSFEFLCALKTIRSQFRMLKEDSNQMVQLLMIDRAGLKSTDIEHSDNDISNLRLPKSASIQQKAFREHMPAPWQEFVTHRLLLQGPFLSGHTGRTSHIFKAKWEKPFLKLADHFVIQDNGIKLAN